MEIIRKKKMKYIISIIIAVIVVIAVCVGGFFLKQYKQTKKENNLVLFQSSDGSQEIYILGTIHSEHYEKFYDYSIANIQSVIDTINPDILLVEARQGTIDKYNALDGPSEMIFAWSYAKEKRLNVRGIDWWQISENTKANATFSDDTERDNHIFENIIAEMGNSKKVLVICGASHRIEQSKRFADNGYNKIELKNIDEYFYKVSPENFTYPQSMKTEFEKKIEYEQTGFVEEINNSTSEQSEARQYWLQQVDRMVTSTKEMLDNLIIPNKLYFDN